MTDLMKGYLISTGFLYVFYGNTALILAAALPPAAFLAKEMKRRRKEKDGEELLLQFKDCIMAVSASLETGYSMENAMREAEKEMKRLYGAESPMALELSRMVRQLELNRPVDEVWQEFADCNPKEDIIVFAQIFHIVRRMGGDLTAVIRRTSDTIGDKLGVREEIVTLTASVKLQNRIMSLMPLGIILFMNAGSGGFLDILYTTAIGRVIMTACLGLYLAALYLADKISGIEVGL